MLPIPTNYDGIDPDAGLIIATVLPGRPADFAVGAAANWDQLASLGTPEHPIWIHLDRTRPRAAQWLREQSGLDPLVAEALLAEETQPRGMETCGGFLIILRGVNMNPGAARDELITIRMWVEPRRVITLRHEQFHTVRDIRMQLQRGVGPKTPSGIALAVAKGITERLWPVDDNLEETLDEIEDQLAANCPDKVDGSVIAAVRREAITVRRYLAPQRDTLRALADTPSELLHERLRAELRELSEQTARIVEDLEEIRDRAAVASDQLRAQRDRRAANTTYLLTLVAAVFLPLTLITGLLGVNVGGIPGAEHPAAFWVVLALLALTAAGLVVLFKRLRWL